jgi:hypothetical protein
METAKLTKKELNETARWQTFTGHRTKINCLWYDWKDGEYVEGGITKRFVGASFMVAGLNATKKDVLNYAHEFLTTGIEPIQYNMKSWVASEDKFRKKMPLQFDWNKW